MFIVGFLIFALGMTLMLPSIVLNASGANIKTKWQATSFIIGNVVGDLSRSNLQNDFSKTNLLSQLPAVLVVIGLVLMILAFVLRF